MRARDPQSGVVLVNVLVILAIAASVVLLMLGSRDAALDRVARQSDAVQAEWLALGAEASVVDALRRDLETAPDSDHYAEPWTRVNQDEVTLAGGQFSVTVTDAQARFDINRLAAQGFAAVEFFARLLALLDLPPERAGDVAAALQRLGPVGDLRDLERLGLPGDMLDKLAPYVTALPVEGTINLNTAPPLLLQAMFNNRAIAARVQRLRDTDGMLTRAGLEGIGALRPENSGFTSNVFDLEVLAEVGAARVRLQSRIVRTNDLQGRSVTVYARRLLPVGDLPPEE
ncbi:general secretion pathway protein GspK [Thalassococcus sp. BH17M4-6]|uniref:general secretion pathway protein GspK n=1 Tax=Thalassococcus sp. BH17M4-6 TaxID=3413148 RepID=UPI003BD06116